jgi:5-methylcytosine-specific restriction protein A
MSEYQHLYRTAEWQEFATGIKVRDNWTCRLCGLVCTGKGEAIADHIIPHKGDLRLFWDPENVQTLCKPCHDGPKKRMEVGTRMVRTDGWVP